MSAELLRTLLPDELLAALADTYERVVACGADAAQRLESGVRHGLDATVEAYASANWTALLPTRLLPPAALPEFSELQRSLLIVFLVIIAVNLLLIAYYWRKYGGVITDRFIRPSKCSGSGKIIARTKHIHRQTYVVTCFSLNVSICCMLCVCASAFCRRCDTHTRTPEKCNIPITQPNSLFRLPVCAGTLKEIEELKLSVAKLKLPFEHTPRI